MLESVSRVADKRGSMIDGMPMVQETVTEMRHFMLAADGQLHDLHSKLRLDHRAGQATQLHKCIVSGSTGAHCTLEPPKDDTSCAAPLYS
jgi:hypothetical protein